MDVGSNSWDQILRHLGDAPVEGAADEQLTADSDDMSLDHMMDNVLLGRDVGESGTRENSPTPSSPTSPRGSEFQQATREGVKLGGHRLNANASLAFSRAIGGTGEHNLSPIEVKSTDRPQSAIDPRKSKIDLEEKSSSAPSSPLVAKLNSALNKVKAKIGTQKKLPESTNAESRVSKEGVSRALGKATWVKDDGAPRSVTNDKEEKAIDMSSWGTEVGDDETEVDDKEEKAIDMSSWGAKVESSTKKISDTPPKKDLPKPPGDK